MRPEAAHFELSPDWLTLFSREAGAFVYRDLNPATVRGYGLARDAVVGHDLRDILGAGPAVVPMRAMERALADGRPQRYVARRTMAGVTRLIDVRVSVVPGAQLAVAARDISALERALGNITGVRETRGHSRAPPPFDADDLMSWQMRLGLPVVQAARILGLSVAGYRKQLSGERPVSWQTYRLAGDIEMLRALRLDPLGY